MRRHGQLIEELEDKGLDIGQVGRLGEGAVDYEVEVGEEGGQGGPG